jgi:hypothetical protein
LSAAQQERLRELASDLRLVWQHRAASAELKKRILRTVIEEIVVHSSDDPPQHVLHVHWKGGVHTTLHVKKNGTGQHGRVADEKAVELIEELSKVYSDETIAQVLNRLGYRTGQGNTWRVHHVHNLRYWRGLPNYHRTGEWLSLEETARELGVSNTVIKRLIRERTLPARQVVRYASWVIERSSVELPEVQASIQAVHDGRKLLRPTPEQGEFSLK